MKIKNDLKLSEIIGSLFCTSVILLFVVMLIVQVGCERKPISPQEAAPAVETPVVDVFAMTDEQIRQRINELYAEMMNLKDKRIDSHRYITRAALIHTEISLLLHVKESRRME